MKMIQSLLQDEAVKLLKDLNKEDVKGGGKRTAIEAYQLKSQSSPPRWKDTE